MIIIFKKQTDRLSELWRYHPQKTHTLLTTVSRTSSKKVLLVMFEDQKKGWDRVRS